MNQPGQAKNLTPGDVVRVLLRHRRKAVIAFSAILGTTVLTLIVWPRSYMSEAMLFVRVGRESVTLDPTVTTAQTINLQKFQEEEINSILEILNSREILERVVDAIGPEAILDPPALPGKTDRPKDNQWRETIATALSKVTTSIYRGLEAIRLKDRVSPRERAIRRLDDQFYARAPKRSTVVTINCTSKTPAAAQEIVAVATDAFLAQHAHLGGTKGSHDFFAAQADQLHAELVQSEEDLRDRKNKYGLADIQSKREILKNQISNVELALLDAERDLKTSETRMKKLAGAIEALPPEIVGQEIALANAARDGMRQDLYKLQIEEQDLLARRTANHPSVRAVVKQREQIEQILDRQPPIRPQQTMVPNPIRKQLEAQFLSEEANAAATLARKTTLSQQRATLQKQLRALNAQDVEIAELSRRVDLLDGKYRVHVSKLEQARIGKALQAERISSINVVQPATFQEKPVSPRKLVSLVAGFMLAVVGSLGIISLAEGCDCTLRTPEQIEAQLELPVLASVSAEESCQPVRRRTTRGTPDRAPSTNGTCHSRLACGPSYSYQALAGRLRGLENGTLLDTAHHAVTVGVVRCTADDNYQTVAVDLAINAAEATEQPVLLIDADLRQRTIGRAFGAEDAPGICDVLQGRAEAANCILEPNVPNLSLLTAGAQVGASLPYLNWRKISRQLDPVSDKFGMVILDLPVPSLESVDVALAGELDAVLLVVESGRTRIEVARRIEQHLQQVKANVLGVVLMQRHK